MSCVNRKIRIAIFEDESMVRNMLEMLLFQYASIKGIEYEILLYEDPTACPFKGAEKCLCSENEICTDIIITDINMPHVSGIELIKGQIEKGCKVRNILVISGYTDQKIIEWVLGAGCKYLHKPFQMSELYDTIDKFEENIDFGMVPKDLSDYLD